KIKEKREEGKGTNGFSLFDELIDDVSYRSHLSQHRFGRRLSGNIGGTLLLLDDIFYFLESVKHLLRMFREYWCLFSFSLFDYVQCHKLMTTLFCFVFIFLYLIY